MIASFYREWDSRFIDRLIDRWDIDPRARVRSLSAGQRQKLSILLALGHRPDLVVLDEPVASLDPVARRQFLEEIVDITHDGRRSVVFSSHIVSDIERLANKIWILKNGQLYWRGDFDALKESIVRVRLNGASALPDTLDIPNALSVERIERSATAVVGHWDSAAEGELARRTGARVEVEHLTLEEIFLELHR
jgi:ABC-2 type transport system ATP-binding protein